MDVKRLGSDTVRMEIQSRSGVAIDCCIGDDIDRQRRTRGDAAIERPVLERVRYPRVAVGAWNVIGQSRLKVIADVEVRRAAFKFVDREVAAGVVERVDQV